MFGDPSQMNEYHIEKLIIHHKRNKTRKLWEPCLSSVDKECMITHCQQLIDETSDTFRVVEVIHPTESNH